MKKKLSIIFILLFALCTSGCVGNFAVLKLNKIANQYADEGDYVAAIARWEASIDLDGNIYETRFNLANAYMTVGNCERAVEQIKIAQTLNKNEAGVYYMQAISAQCMATNLINSKKVNNNDDVILTDPAEIREYIQYLNDANNAYDMYVKLAPNTDKTRSIIEQVRANRINIKSYSLV